MIIVYAAILLPFLFAVCGPLLNRLLPRVHTGWFMLPVPIVLFVYLLSLIPEIASVGTIESTVPWMPSIGVEFAVVVDGLGLLFALLITGIGLLVVIYSIYYLDHKHEKLKPFYVYLMLFMGAMLGLVLSDNLIVLYGFWELTSISSFLLIAFWNKREKSRYGAMKSMVITVCGGLAMFAGFVLLYVMAGTFSIRELIGQASALAEHPVFLPTILLILLGAFTKSAQFPFHIWLPDAMEAPTPVSAYLHSATMVKAGIYLVARLSPVFAGAALWTWLIAGFGLATLIYGSFRAIKQTDLKAMLAFSTISQLGLIMCLFGLGSAAAFHGGTDAYTFYTKATAAAIFHLLNHAVFKGALFMVVGIVDHETGTRDIRRLGGLMSLMPITFSIAVIGSLSMAGLPPFGGFLSKEMFFTSVLNIRELGLFQIETWGVLFPVVAWVASVFTFVYSLLLLLRTFTGKLQEGKLDRKPHEAPLGLLLPPVVLVAMVVVLGLFPNLVSHSLIEPAMTAVHAGGLLPGEQFVVSIYFWHGWTTELFMTMGVVATGVVVYWLHRRLAVLHEPLAGGWSLNGVYNGWLKRMDRLSSRLTGLYMTGSLRHYLMYTFLFLVVAIGTMLFAGGGFRLELEHLAETAFFETAVLTALVVAALSTVFATSRLMAIILTGAAGYMVTLFFVIFRAPDLALTQIIVETVSVALFLLCFYHLPKLKRESTPLRLKLRNGAIALGVGVTMTLVALSVLSEGAKLSFESISHYFLENSYKLAGGKNVVNVILVDFRGFDTLLEIMVLGVASFGIYALIKIRRPKSENEPLLVRESEFKFDVYAGLRSNDVILQTVARFAIVLIMLISLYLFYMGHNHPGGGFIGALTASAALLLMAVSFGMGAVERRMPMDFRKLTATGLLIAMLTGLGAFLFDAAFLSHAFDYFQIPLIGELELATATLFDLGVYFAVIGVAMTIIFSIGREE